MNQRLSRYWIVFGVIALLVSGLLAVVVTGAKMPGIKQVVDIEMIRWSLVVHVNLSTLVWFTAIPAGILYFSTRAKGNLSAQISWTGFFLSILGVLLLFSVPPQEGVRPILANYIPVLSHERYYLGLALYLLGLVLSILSPKVFSQKLTPGWHGFYEARFGVLVGALFLIMAVVTLAGSLPEVLGMDLTSDMRKADLIFWGPGHMIQHAAVVFTVCCWVAFLSKLRGESVLSRTDLFVVFAWMGLPLFVAPLLMYQDVDSWAYRNGFTHLMRWGMAPPVLYFLFIAIRKSQIRWWKDLRQNETIAFALSALLLVLGFTFGAFIRGSDMRVPGHYHASIGAVTLAFMAFSYLVLSGAYSKWILRSTWCYGVGQTIFAGGMFVAGAFGMPRKTYGSEHIITHWGQSAGLGMMAIGGLIALAGGILFAVAIIPALRAGDPVVAAHPGPHQHQVAPHGVDA